MTAPSTPKAEESDSDIEAGGLASRPLTLQEGAVLPATEARYNDALAHFQTWWSERFVETFPDGNLSFSAPATRMLDRRMAAFLEDLYHDREGKASACAAVCGAQHRWPELRGTLKRSWRHLRTWNFIVPGIFRKPWPAELVLAMAALALVLDREDVAIYYLLTFHCLLRPLESCSLRVADIYIKKGMNVFSRHFGIVTLHLTKTRRACARTQHTTIFSEVLLNRLEVFLAARDRSELPFPTYSLMRRLTSRWLSELLGNDHGFSLGGLRAGGATFYFLEYEDIQWVQRRGRWSVLRSLDHYVQEGAAVLGTNIWSAEAQRKVSRLAATMPNIFLESTRFHRR